MSKSEYRYRLPVGYRRGLITVINKPELVFTGQKKNWMYRCKCDCGNDLILSEKTMKHGRHSCGCMRVKVTWTTTHGVSGTKLYSVWSDIKRRCHNPKNKQFSDYGGRGIIVCPEWRNSVKLFYDWSMDNGYVDGLQIDRINNDGNYEPSNCRWTTPSINAQNRRIRSDNTSGYKGVSRNDTKWAARITVNKKRVVVGNYGSPIEAATAYNDFVIKNRTDHTLNIIPV